MMKVFVFLLPPESSLTEVFIMSETPWGFSSEIISSLSQSTSGAHLMTPLQVLRVLPGLALTGQPARLSTLLTLRLHGRRNLQQEVSVSESSESFNCPHCAFYGFAQKECRQFRDWVVAIHRLDNKPPVIMTVHSVVIMVFIS